MTVSASIDIEQFDSVSFEGHVSDKLFPASNEGVVRTSLFSNTAQLTFTSLPTVSQPVPRPGAKGWPTEDEEDWSDSPTKQPGLLYRHRYGWGRDRAEAYDTGFIPTVINAPPDPGERWGNLDDNSSVLIYEREFPVSAEGSLRQFLSEGVGTVRDSIFYSTEDFSMSHIGEITSDFTITEYPFILSAIPEAYSIKNPVDTDVYIRLANYAHTIVSGSITMSLNGLPALPLSIVEFFGGLGGFDVTWNNAYNFDYDSNVNVIVEFLDSDTPANKITIEYPFFIVKDLAPPRIINRVPDDNSQGITPLGTLQFELVDYETGVDLSSLRLYVNNILIESGVHGNVVTTAREDGLGYVVSYTPFESWLYGDEIPVAVFIKDTSPSSNELFYSYSFNVLESTPPKMININPGTCTEDVVTGTSVLVDVIDGGHGINKDSVSVSVEDKERSDDIIVIPIVHRDE